MKSLRKSYATAALICTLSLSAGCQSLPWAGNQSDESTITAEQYVEQTAANVQYDTEVDMDIDYQPREARSTSVASSSAQSSLSSGGGSCCH